MWIWDSRTHQYITSQALKKCKKSFCKLILVHHELFVFGIEAPDRIFKDFTNHYFNCTENKYGVHSGKIISKINTEIELLKSMIANPTTIIHRPKLAPFVRIMLDTPLKSFIFELGVLSHYIADLHQPLHTDGKERFDDEETVHKIMEADTRKHLDDFKLRMRKKRTRIKKPLEYFEKQIYKINKNYDSIIENYYLKKGKVKRSRWNKTFPLVQYCLSAGAQNIANIFLDFEPSVKIFKNEIRLKMNIDKIADLLDINSTYKIKPEADGDINIKKRK